MKPLERPFLPAPAAASRGFFGLLWAMLRLRCPRCRRGRMFRSSLVMNDPCPVCGMVFRREEGYFLGAMYCSYIIATVLLTAFYFGLAALLPGWSSIAVALLALVPYLPLIPAVFRYSRMLWIYFDRAGDPYSANAGAYEKRRIHQAEANSVKADPESPDR
jgi:uncharacterized protein (DUF983 family)